MFGLLQPEHLALILVIVLIVFGAGKLPDTMRDLGRGVRSFRDEADSHARAQSQPVTVPAAPIASAEATCPSCGKSTPSAAKFCPACGKAI